MPVPVDVLLDPGRNLLILCLSGGEPVGPARPAAATIDVGEGGRLLAVEVAVDAAPSGAGLSPSVSFDPVTSMLTIELGRQTEGFVRSASARVGLVVDGRGVVLAVELPRRGAGYEITYPSGNRCWMERLSGSPLRCASLPDVDRCRPPDR